MKPPPRVLALVLPLAALAAACTKPADSGPAATPAASPQPAAETKPGAPAEAPLPAPAAKPSAKAPTAEAPKPEAPKADLPTGNRPGMVIPPFSATARVMEGGAMKEAPIESRTTGKVTVWMVTSSTCPVTKRYAPHVVEMEKAYLGRGVRFVHVYPNRTETVESKRGFHQAKGFHGEWIEDQEASIAKLLAATKTPEIYLATADGTIVYRGAIDDSGGDFANAEKHYLKDALDAVLAGQPVKLRETVPAG